MREIRYLGLERALRSEAAEVIEVVMSETGEVEDLCTIGAEDITARVIENVRISLRGLASRSEQ